MNPKMKNDTNETTMAEIMTTETMAVKTMAAEMMAAADQIEL